MVPSDAAVKNLRLEQKALERAKNVGKAKKFKKAQPPEKGFVMWNEDTFRKNETGAPETLESSFESDARDDPGRVIASRRASVPPGFAGAASETSSGSVATKSERSACTAP